MIFPQFLLDLLYLPALPPIYVLFSFKTQQKEVENTHKTCKTTKTKIKTNKQKTYKTKMSNKAK